VLASVTLLLPLCRDAEGVVLVIRRAVRRVGVGDDGWQLGLHAVPARRRRGARVVIRAVGADLDHDLIGPVPVTCVMPFHAPLPSVVMSVASVGAASRVREPQSGTPTVKSNSGEVPPPSRRRCRTAPWSPSWDRDALRDGRGVGRLFVIVTSSRNWTPLRISAVFIVMAAIGLTHPFGRSERGSDAARLVLIHVQTETSPLHFADVRVVSERPLLRRTTTVETGVVGGVASLGRTRLWAALYLTTSPLQLCFGARCEPWASRSSDRRIAEAATGERSRACGGDGGYHILVLHIVSS